MGRKWTTEHLAVIRLSSVSRTAISVPVIRGLRAAYPDMDITVVTPSAYHPLFDGISGLRLVRFDHRKGFPRIAGLLSLRRRLIADGVDTLANFSMERSVRWLMYTFSPLRFRTDSITVERTGRRMLTRKFRKVFEQQRPLYERYCDTLARLGIPAAPILPQRQKRTLPESVAAKAGVHQGVWIGVAPFASYDGKTYPPAMTDRLIELLCLSYERVFVFGADRYERQFAEAMERLHEGTVSVAYDEMDLESQLAVMSNLDMMVCVDSAPMHMAALMGTPTVTLWGATHPMAGFCYFGQPEDSLIQIDLPCRPCSAKGRMACIMGNYECMNRITPEMVARKVALLLADDNKNREK